MNRRSTLLLASACTALAVGALTSGCQSTASQPPSTEPNSLSLSTTPQTTGSCPVDASTLTAALGRNAKIEGELAQPASVLTPTCYQGYATAMTAPKPGLDAPAVLFRFDTATSEWVAVNVGTSDLCKGLVPDSVAKHLPHCA